MALKYIDLRRSARLGSADIRRLQLRRLDDLVSFARRRAPFYTGHLKNYDGSIESIPPLDKAQLMADLSRANTRGFPADDILDHCVRAETARDFTTRFHGCTAAFSSGTSGNRGVELLSRAEEQVIAALYLARFPFPPGPLRVAFALRVSSPGLSRRFLGNRLIYIDAMRPVEELVAQINHDRPTVLAAQPSLLRVFALEYQAGRLKWAPTVAIGYAEVFGETEKAFIAESFGCSVHEIYKCTEGAIAQTCRHGRLHINEDLVLLEMQPLGGSGSGEGNAPEVAQITVTNLTRRVLPIIRFQLNDCVELDPEACPCGCAFRVIKAVYGRANDLLWFKRLHESGLGLVLPDYFERAVITSSDAIEEYQIVQTSRDSVTIRIQLADHADKVAIYSSIGSFLERVFRKCDCIRPTLEYEFGPVERGRLSGKLIRVRKEWQGD